MAISATLQRDIPRATYLSIGIAAATYVLIAIAVFGTLTVTAVRIRGDGDRRSRAPDAG